ncbi:excalibur calcium-binding domain-containing protein [Actinomyces bowdenii]|uniref:excalibur calcium-binding domain-containing protein n=1 Tax=Actinomyces bowdenii TaxID=131109 RepID=UPI001ABC0A6E|nr:excalibur calcium-binding domain-containing protein [Actinomyces bowdenii]MBO3724766.1 excalibur calcium-binding domain-containing protein [Actinomyces bowdenii]
MSFSVPSPLPRSASPAPAGAPAARPRLLVLTILPLLALCLVLSGCDGSEASAGGAPSATTTAGTVLVPDVVGMKGDAAADALAAAGLTSDPTYTDADGEESVWKPGNWSVTAQDPAAGTEAPADQVVALTVNHDSADAAATQSAQAEASRQAAEQAEADRAAQEAAEAEASRQAAEQAEAERAAQEAAEEAARQAEQDSARQEAQPEPAAPAAEHYSSCREARAAGAAPLYAGQPGYRSDLDRDGDGVACEVK